MNSKEYVMPDGKKAVFEYDHDGIGKVTIEAMDMLMGLIADGRKRGEWVIVKEPIEKYGEVLFDCSACGLHFYRTEHRQGAKIGWNFCPNCGADMRGKDDEVR